MPGRVLIFRNPILLWNTNHRTCWRWWWRWRWQPGDGGGSGGGGRGGSSTGTGGTGTGEPYPGSPPRNSPPNGWGNDGGDGNGYGGGGGGAGSTGFAGNDSTSANKGVVKVYNYQQHSEIQQQHMDSLDLHLEDSGLLAAVVVDHIH